MRTVNASNLRKNIYRLLDEVLGSGEPLEIERHGQRLLISRDDNTNGKLSRLVPHDCIVGDPDELVHMDWSDTWDGEL